MARQQSGMGAILAKMKFADRIARAVDKLRAETGEKSTRTVKRRRRRRKRRARGGKRLGRPRKDTSAVNVAASNGSRHVAPKRKSRRAKKTRSASSTKARVGRLKKVPTRRSSRSDSDGVTVGEA